jgi:hypothetical protein
MWPSRTNFSAMGVFLREGTHRQETPLVEDSFIHIRTGALQPIAWMHLAPWRDFLLMRT